MITISAKSEYGLFFLVFLARNIGKVISLTQVAKNEKISRGYLEEIAADLKKADILKGKKGKGGGYVLARKAKDIKISEIITALEGSISPVKCLSLSAQAGDAKCFKENVCGTKKIWMSLKDKVEEHLRGISLADIV